MHSPAIGSVKAGLKGFKYGSTDLLLDFIQRSLRIEPRVEPRVELGNESTTDAQADELGDMRGMPTTDVPAAATPRMLDEQRQRDERQRQQDQDQLNQLKRGKALVDNVLRHHGLQAIYDGT
jgi:hypothetical protein